ncbi:hypothetical protein GGD41_000248 [Paraburkholderia bryophila]|uniref:Uncharacterized protein n=1 Tax=Paraburkholderia bryophila TaxID=420952 RepID=A0A7Y9WP06_9BURK|nr:hypothetical protein [Paraburkholderia bryophila]NYH24449.1 hypothetical protein [Paraburkholderia bryophila]
MSRQTGPCGDALRSSARCGTAVLHLNPQLAGIDGMAVGWTYVRTPASGEP